MNNENRKCNNCDTELILCPNDWPKIKDYWICPECDAVHVVFNLKEIEKK